MEVIDKQILEINKVICNNIDRFGMTERGLLSQNILSQLRNFVEHISLKVYSRGNNIENTYQNITKAIGFIKTKGQLRFLYKFHYYLQIIASHYTLDEQNSERLVLKYYEFLLRIKSFLKENYGLTVLENINKFPINSDSSLKEYYEKIADRIKYLKSDKTKNPDNDRYYIHKIKPFFVGYEVFYEVTFTIANDRINKLDRIIAFTELDISTNYAVKLSIFSDEIKILGKKMPILIIDNWEISIRPCELNNFARIFGLQAIHGGTPEYHDLMDFLKKTGLDLVEVVNLTEKDYLRFKEIISTKSKTVRILNLLDRCRNIIVSDFPGSNVIRYLLYCLNNKVIKLQYSLDSCKPLSSLNLSYKCIPFDDMPFNTSLVEHNPRLSDLLHCIDIGSRKHELLARLIKINTDNGNLYTPKSNINNFNDIDVLIGIYNDKLYKTHKNRSLAVYKEHVFIKGYEEDTFHIIETIKALSRNGIKNYSNSFRSWLQSSPYKIDCSEKKAQLIKMFEQSEVALIYGSAGTGKSTLINHIAHFFNEQNKIFLAHTNPAVDNLQRRVNSANCTFMTISKFLSNRNTDVVFDLLVIDECSTVSNENMLALLNKATFRLLVLVGDTFQIESIRFGNWFSVVQSFIPATSIFELTKPYRTQNSKLQELWDRVRNMDETILEHLTQNGYSVSLNDTIFEHSEDDEIILCLNYDGLYGINNINRFLQGNNNSAPKQWGVQIYKVNDPILFNESNRFSPVIYNNLKGKIVGIEVSENQIQFDIEVYKVLNEFDAYGHDFELLGNSENGYSVIRFLVNKLSNTDEDDDASSNTVVPFQVAYAVSIHKAQGLEYDSIKIVITDEVEEMITHNIFYTAITRARKKLKIFWTPETEKKILSNLKIKNNNKDASLLASKFKL